MGKAGASSRLWPSRRGAPPSVVPMGSNLRDSGAIPHFGDPCFVSATGAAIKGPICLYPVADNLAAAVIANGSKGMNRAFEAIECMRYAGGYDLKSLIVIVSTDFTLCHLWTSFLGVFLASPRIILRLPRYFLANPAPE